MDNAQLAAPDGRWFLFADWQGMTRIRLPGDAVKTDANLDRPDEAGPLALRADGRVRSTCAVDVDPETLTALDPEGSGSTTPDPLGGPDLELREGGRQLVVRGRTVRLKPRGEPIQLGGAPGRFDKSSDTRHALYPDRSIVVRFDVDKETNAALVVRTPDGVGRLAWCYPVLRPLYGSLDAFRERGSTWLADRDLALDVAYLVEIADDGGVGETARAPAVAGPWMLDGQVWWQPDDATLCAGPQLGAAARSYTLPGEHAGPGRLLRLSGRRLFVPWHGGVILDLAADLRELPRDHQPADATMYRAAERLLRPIREGMARRGVRVAWTACTRTPERIELQLEIAGPPDLLTYILGHALGDLPPPLARTTASRVRVFGGRTAHVAQAQLAATTEQDLQALLDMFDAAGISRARGLVHMHDLADAAPHSGSTLQLAPEVDALALAAVLSGLRGETRGPVPLATDDELADVVPMLGDRNRLDALGLDAYDVALFLTIFGHRALGPAAAAPVYRALIAMDRGNARTVARALGVPFTCEAPPRDRPGLDAAQARVAGVLEALLADEFDVDAAASRDDDGAYHFEIDGAELHVGLAGALDLAATLCTPGAEVDTRLLARRIKAANKGRSGPPFTAEDGAIQARVSVPFSEASLARVKAALAACCAALDSPQGQKLRAAYR